jgi:hypothetical protein
MAGNFDVLVMSVMERTMLADAYNAITKTDNWKFMRDFEPKPDEGFMLSSSPELQEIGKHITYGHSGMSYGVTMRTMQFIAKNGWEEFASPFKRSLVHEIFAYFGVSTDPSVKCPIHPEMTSYACMDCNH